MLPAYGNHPLLRRHCLCCVSQEIHLPPRSRPVWRPSLSKRRQAHGQAAQKGGFLRARCAFAASTHHNRSSTNRGNAFSSALPPSPIGEPSTDKVCEIDPTAIALDIT